MEVLLIHRQIQTAELVARSIKPENIREALGLYGQYREIQTKAEVGQAQTYAWQRIGNAALPTGIGTFFVLSALAVNLGAKACGRVHEMYKKYHSPQG